MSVLPRVLLLVSTFVVAQLLTQFHGAQYGFAPHTHDGIACQTAITNENFEAIEPVGAVLPAPPSVYSRIAFYQIRDAAHGARPVAPTARAPPRPTNVV